MTEREVATVDNARILEIEGPVGAFLAIVPIDPEKPLWFTQEEAELIAGLMLKWSHRPDPQMRRLQELRDRLAL